MTYKIITYSQNLNNDIINFLINITIDEFGHNNWLNYLQNKDFSPYLLNTSIFLIVLDEHNKIIGTCGGLKVDNETIKINSFYIAKKYRNNGIGKVLYNKILDFSKNKYKNIILCTYKEYDIAMNFYKNNDFKVYKRDGDEIWMKKKI